MRLGRYQFTCRFLDEALLPPYKGSTFRGAFGAALKQVVCAVREKDCSRCLLASRCVYARIFETAPARQEQGLRLAASPHPYVIEPPSSPQTRFAEGDLFHFDLLLFGEFTEYLPYFVYAFESMGEQGLGGRRRQGLGRYQLESVTCGNQAIYNAADRKLAVPKPQNLTLDDGSPATGLLRLQLLTPLRLKYDNQLQAELPFHLLVRACLRRISGVFSCFGSGEPALDYRGLVARAAQVQVCDAKLRWCDWQRYSNRQEQTMLMGGMLGEISYRGELGEYLPLLDLARELHLGKQTAFGLGQIDVRFHPEAAR